MSQAFIKLLSRYVYLKNGEYIFRTSVRISENYSYQQCFDVRIVCTEPATGNIVLPADPGKTGFGYNRKAKKYGLFHPSKTAPTVNVKHENGSDEVLSFKVEEDRVNELEFSSEFVENESENAPGTEHRK